MNKNSIAVWIVFVVMVLSQQVWAEDRAVKIIQPSNNAQLSSPAKVCMEVSGIVVEKAKKGVNEGRGHHHLLLNSLPADLSQPIGKQEIHMGDGSICKDLKLVPGRHVIFAVFAYGNHVPYDPPITDRIIISIKD
ncbi:MAG: DUF4399 domain-containing protein [Nitrospina sp.]|jgi:hypothetical protein|nr:DUF4399 domain-containing protein [Nitrospina sp.]